MIVQFVNPGKQGFGNAENPYFGGMEGQDLTAWYLLKDRLGNVYHETFPDSPSDIRSLSGPEFRRFQQHLMDTVQGRVSEKWFYTHIKPETNSRLPRVDVLNLLSRYAGAESWMEFKAGVQVDHSDIPAPASDRALSKRLPTILIGVLIGGVVLIGMGFLLASPKPSKKICLVDGVFGTSIRDSALQVLQLIEGESPRLLSAQEDGCITISRAGEFVRVVAKVPYYRQDTLIRSWKEIQDGESFVLQPDDVANMVRYFSAAASADRIKRSSQLTQMIAPDARMIRMHSDGLTGVEMYAREEFVRYLLVFGQQNLRVLETAYENGLVSQLRFIVE